MMSARVFAPARACAVVVRAAHSDAANKIVVSQKRQRKASGPVALPSATRRVGVHTLGCSQLFFESWTEFLMDNSDEGFTWDNRGFWNFDHTVPQHAAKHGHVERRLVDHWSNLRPMNSRVNSSKGHRRDPADEAEHLRMVQKFLIERTYGDL